MFTAKVINGIAIAVVSLFVIQTGADIALPKYEVPAGMYGIVTILVTAIAGAAAGIKLGGKKDNGDKE